MFFHTINAYEEDNHIVADICCFQDGTIIEQLNHKSLSKDSLFNSFPQIRRYVLPLIKSDQNLTVKILIIYYNIRKSVYVLQKNVEENLVKLKSTEATAFAKNGSIHINHESLTELGRKNNLKVKSNS